MPNIEVRTGILHGIFLKMVDVFNTNTYTPGIQEYIKLLSKEDWLNHFNPKQEQPQYISEKHWCEFPVSSENSWFNAERQKYTKGENATWYNNDFSVSIEAKSENNEITKTNEITSGRLFCSSLGPSPLYHKNNNDGFPLAHDFLSIGNNEELTIEFAARLPVARDGSGNEITNQPIWPALWMLGDELVTLGWPTCSEIDVMEFSPSHDSNNNDDFEYTTAVHFDQQPGHNFFSSIENTNPNNTTEKYNVYGAKFTRNSTQNIYKVEMMFNTQVVYTYTISGNNKEVLFTYTDDKSAIDESKQKKYFLLMNVAVGSSNTAYTNGATLSTDFHSATMDVNYVLVRKRRIHVD